MQRKKTITEWLESVGIDTNAQIDIATADRLITDAQPNLKNKADKAKRAYSLSQYLLRLDI